MGKVAEYITALLAASRFARQITCHRIEPGRKAAYGETRRPWPRAIADILTEQGIPALYTHQAQAADLVRAGRDLVVATPTASGKTLCYNLPILERFLQDPDSRTLMLFPLKALAQDQFAAFERLTAHWPADARPTIALYDGDTSDYKRRKIRNTPPNVLITNPEMLHLGILPHHAHWTTFLASLSLVVVDEAHTYRGVFGAHISQLFHRLERLSGRYGATPQYVLCTATVGNPEDLACRLLGRPLPGSPAALSAPAQALSVPAPNGISGPALVPTSAPALASVPASAPASVSDPASNLVPVSASTPVQAAFSPLTSAPAPESASGPAPVPDAASTPTAAASEARSAAPLSPPDSNSGLLSPAVSPSVSAPAQPLGQEAVFPVIRHSGAPSGKRHFIFIDPEESPSTMAIQLLKAALARSLRTIVYCRSRRMTELIALWASQSAGSFAGRISAYRAGFLPEERREIEARMSSGELLAVITTSALELGIDIGTLDVCLLVGYPGTVMSTLQRGGRVGRAGQESAVVLIAGEDALDQYFVHSPEAFFNRPPEQAILNPDNEVILKRHLECAAAEYPIPTTDPWLATPGARTALSELASEGLLLQSGDGTEWLAARKRPQRDVDLRGCGASYTIFDSEKKPIGSVDGHQAFTETHPGAVYLHRGRTYTVKTLDPATRQVHCETPLQRVNWHTRARTRKETEIIKVLHTGTAFGAPVGFGRLRVTETVTGYEQRSNGDNRLLTIVPLTLPPQIFETEGLWFCIPDVSRRATEDALYHFMGSIHALEHACIGLMPLMVMADRNDFGGISTPMHAQTGRAVVFIYDGLPGGAGLSRAAFPRLEALFSAVQTLLKTCPCETGCPSCVHSPKCGSGNRPIDKAGALFLLSHILTAPKPDPLEIRPLSPPAPSAASSFSPAAAPSAGSSAEIPAFPREAVPSETLPPAACPTDVPAVPTAVPSFSSAAPSAFAAPSSPMDSSGIAPSGLESSAVIPSSFAGMNSLPPSTANFIIPADIAASVSSVIPAAPEAPVSSAPEGLATPYAATGATRDPSPEPARPDSAQPDSARPGSSLSGSTLPESLLPTAASSGFSCPETSDSKNASALPERYMVFDVETRRSAAEVGGWNHTAQMGVSIVVVYDSGDNAFHAYEQDQLPALFTRLRQASLVIGFNSIRFDYGVLQPFAPFDLRTLPTLDLLDVINKRLSYRVSLDNLGRSTLNAPKTSDGLQALRWWQEGRLDLITTYCQHDVAITRDLYLFGHQNQFLLFSNKSGQVVRVPVNW